MGGKELNSAIDFLPSRWVIAMGARDYAAAATYKEPIRCLEERVKAWRQYLDRAKYKRVVDGWCKFFHSRAQLFDGIQRLGLQRVLARSRLSDHHMVAFLDVDIMYGY